MPQALRSVAIFFMVLFVFFFLLVHQTHIFFIFCFLLRIFFLLFTSFLLLTNLIFNRMSRRYFCFFVLHKTCIESMRLT